MEAARWIVLVVAVLGLALFFSDLVLNIKKRRNTKLNVLALIFLSLSVVCYVLTQFVFVDSLPKFFTLIWIPFLVAYFVCDVILAVCIGKDNSRKKNEVNSGTETDSDENE